MSTYSAISATSQTLSILSSVVGFDVIEYWTPDDNGDLQCEHFYISNSVKQVVKRIYPDEASFSPGMSTSWRQNSLKVFVYRCYDVMIIFVL